MYSILHITSVHNWDDVRIYCKECRTLVLSGYRVSIIAPGISSCDKDGIRFVGIPRYGDRFKRAFLGNIRVAWIAFRENADVYHIHDPELIPVGLGLRLLCKRVVFDAHEDLSKQIYSKPYIHSSLRPLVKVFAKLLDKTVGLFMTRIVAATPSIAGNFPAHMVRVVQNFPLKNEFTIPSARQMADRDKSVGYVGGITVARGLWPMLEALNIARFVCGARLIMAGNFDSESVALEARRHPGWESVKYYGWRSRSDVKDMFGSVRAGLVLFQPQPNHIESQPNKLFEYMSAGLPVIASDFPLWRELIEANACGILVDPCDAYAIAKAIAWVINEPKKAEAMGQRGRQAVETVYNWDAESRKLLEIYKEIL